MNLRQVIPTDVTASAIAHLSLLALVVLFSDVHPFGTVTAEPIAIDIVTPKEIAEQTPEPVATPSPQPDFAAIEQPASVSAPAPPPQAPAPPQKQATPAASHRAGRPAAR